MLITFCYPFIFQTIVCLSDMSLGMLASYGSGSDSDNDEESQKVTKDASGPGLQDRMRMLSEGVGHALSLPPPPPPPEPASEPVYEPLPNPMKAPKGKAKQKTIPGMSKKEMELMMKNAKWMDITTEELDEDGEAPEFEYNTPLPFSKDSRPEPGLGEEPQAAGASSQDAEYDYMTYVAEYQNYMAQSAALMQGQERAHQLAQEAAEAGGEAGATQESGEAGASDQGASGGRSGQLWDEYMTKYSAWYAQYGSGTGDTPAQPVQPQLRQKTFEELQEQDRQLEAYFNSEKPNEYNTQRDAFKSSFRGTRRYRMLNGGNYNARHFNTLSTGAKKFAEMYPKQKSVMVDKDAYVADKDLPENQDIKSNKQRKKDKWFQGMVEKKKGCKKCGYVFCRCYGWEFKPSHCK